MLALPKSQNLQVLHRRRYTERVRPESSRSYRILCQRSCTGNTRINSPPSLLTTATSYSVHTSKGNCRVSARGRTWAAFRDCRICHQPTFCQVDSMFSHFTHTPFTSITYMLIKGYINFARRALRLATSCTVFSTRYLARAVRNCRPNSRCDDIWRKFGGWCLTARINVANSLC